jgi:hypothetical protein
MSNRLACDATQPQRRTSRGWRPGQLRIVQSARFISLAACRPGRSRMARKNWVKQSSGGQIERPRLDRFHHFQLFAAATPTSPQLLTPDDANGRLRVSNERERRSESALRASPPAYANRSTMFTQSRIGRLDQRATAASAAAADPIRRAIGKLICCWPVRCAREMINDCPYRPCR